MSSPFSTVSFLLSTHLSLATFATALTFDLIDHSAVIQILDHPTPRRTDQRILDGGEEDPVELLYVLLYQFLIVRPPETVGQFCCGCGLSIEQ